MVSNVSSAIVRLRSASMAGSSTRKGSLGFERYVEPRWRALHRAMGGGATSDQDPPSVATGRRSTAAESRGRGAPLELELVDCDLCGGPTAVDAVAVGEDFEYWTSPDSFLAVRCSACGLVYLDPRPTAAELDRIYPADYHAFDFSEERYGLIHKVRRRLESRRLLRWIGDVEDGATILDVGCGDGFHLELLRTFGPSSWQLVGVEPDPRAAEVASSRGFDIRRTTLDDAEIEPGSVARALLIQTIEHVPDPVRLLSEIRATLAPGGRLLVVTDNVGSPDFRIFSSRHWGGWHFPRHWHLFSEETLTAAAERAGLRVEHIETMVSPVNWVYSVRNLLVDLGAPAWTYRWLSLEGTAALGLGTVLDAVMTRLGRGALLRASLALPHDR
jgi:SAM-dependent methyltransferase